MGYVVLAGLFLLAGVVALIASFVAMPKTVTELDSYSGKRTGGERPNYARRGMILGGVVAIVIAPVVFVLAGIQSVPTKSVGVVTSYGRVGSEYNPGAHWLPPWKSLNVVSDTIQSDSFAQANGNIADQTAPSGVKGYCIAVRLAGLNQGCADVQMQTQVIPTAIPNLYANYSSYGSNLTLDVDQYVVQREVKTDLNRILGDYNVIADVAASLQACSASGTTSCNTSVSQFSQFDPALLTALQSDPELKGNVKVLDVNLQFIHFSGSVETAIESIQGKYQETVAATIQEKTNAAISAANAALISKPNALNAAVLQNECYATIQQAIKANYTGLPATMSCGSGTSSASVLVPAGK
jgi:regulator of protease activity HflC (stomatin/prohibitin superfamily)